MIFHPTAGAAPGAEATLEPDGDRADPQRMMLVAAGAHLFALPLGCVLEILEPRPYSALPGASAAVCGMANVRGRIVTVLDLGAHLGLPPAADSPEHSVVLVEHEGRQVGLAVAEILRILDVDAAALDDSADALRALGFERAGVVGAGEVDERLFVALRPQALLGPLFASRRTQTNPISSPEAG